MTRIIELGKRGRLVMWVEGNYIRINNETSCTLIVDGKPLNPGETK